jgi:hypothetical protein
MTGTKHMWGVCSSDPHVVVHNQGRCTRCKTARVCVYVLGAFMSGSQVLLRRLHTAC